MSTNPPKNGIEVASHTLLADCERRAIELYYAAPPEKRAGDCRRELVAEFGEAMVTQMLANGIGNNSSANVPAVAPATLDSASSDDVMAG